MLVHGFIIAYTGDSHFFEKQFGYELGEFISQIMTNTCFFNALIDPIIYALRMKDFRESTVKLFRCRRQSDDDE